MYWAPLYSSYLQECDKGCEVLCIYNWLKSVFTAPVHNQCQLEGRRGAGKGSSLSSTHIPAIRLQYIFPSLKRGKEGAYYTILKKSKLLLVNFCMISAKETSSGTK